jgi:hypothetical protein
MSNTPIQIFSSQTQEPLPFVPHRTSSSATSFFPSYFASWRLILGEQAKTFVSEKSNDKPDFASQYSLLSLGQRVN